MKSVTTESGFSCEIDETCLDDMELFDAICDIEQGQTVKLPIVVSKILGANKKALYDFHRTEDGRVPSAVVLQDVTDIFNQLGKKQ